jgi:hypothetical protein
VSQTAQTREKYWKHWAHYASVCGVNPFLTQVPPIKQDIIVTAFTVRVQSGTIDRGAKVRVGGVTDALAAISKTIKLAGKPSPIYHSDQKYMLAIE